jgi:hypothetical protein
MPKIRACARGAYGKSHVRAALSRPEVPIDPTHGGKLRLARQTACRFASSDWAPRARCELKLGKEKANSDTNRRTEGINQPTIIPCL